MIDSIGQLLSHFDKEEKIVYADVAYRFTMGKNPLIAPTMAQIHKASPNLLSLINHEHIFNFSQDEFNFLYSLSLKKNDLAYSFGSRTDNKERNAISVDKYPLYFALYSINENSPSICKITTQALIWNFTNQNELTRSRVAALIKNLFSGVYKFNKFLSEKIDDWQSQSNSTDFLSIASKTRDLAFSTANQFSDEERKIAGDIVYIIDQAFATHIPKNTTPSSPLFKPELSNEEDSEDTPNLIEVLVSDKPNDLQNLDTEPTEDQYFAIPKDVAEKSTYYQRSYARQTQFKTAMTSQFLDNAPQSLTDSEKNTIIALGLDNLNSTENHCVEFAIIFSLLTGAEPSFWRNWKVIHETESLTDEFCLNLSKGTWSHPITLANRFWKPHDVQQKNLVMESNQRIELPIADEILTFLRRIPNLKSLDEIFTISIAELNHACDQWLREMAYLGRRITIAKVRNFLYWKIMQTHFDEPAASFINSQPILKTPQGCSYTSFESDTLVNIYKSVHEKFSFDSAHTIANQRIGSNLYAKAEYIKNTGKLLADDTIAATIEITEDLTDLKKIINVHNSLVKYCVFYGLLITSHRPNIDPLARFSDFILDLNAVLISDKIVDEQHESRISFYSDGFKKQILTYKDHLTHLSQWLKFLGYPKTSELINTLFDFETPTHLPFFFFLQVNDSKELSTIPISESELQLQIPEWTLPFNFGRHYLSTRLREVETPTEYISYQLGHRSPGEEPYDDNSILSVLIVSKILRPKLNLISDELDFKVIYGLKPCLRNEIMPTEKEVGDFNYQLGPLRRLGNANQARAIRKQTVKEVFHNFIKNQPHEFLVTNQHTIVSEACNKILRELNSDPLKGIILFTHLLERYARTNNLKIQLPHKLIRIQNQKATFDYETFPAWQNLKQIRKSFITKIEHTEFQESTTAQYLAFFFCSLILFSRITHKERFPLILDALYKGSHLNHDGIIYLSIETRKNQIQRLALDKLSSIFFFQLIDAIKKDEQVKYSHMIASLTQLLKSLNTSMKSLFKIINIDSRIYTPGILGAVLSGTRKIASTNESSFLRIISNTRLNLYKPQNQALDKEASPFFKYLSKTAHLLKNGTTNIAPDFKKLKIILNRFRAFLRNPEELIRSELTTKLENEYQRLDEFDFPIPVILKLIAIWAIERLNSPGEVKKELSFGTVYGYFLLIDQSLLEHFIDRDILSEDIESLLETYNYIISAYDLGQQSIVASQIVNFHNLVLSKYFHIEPINKADLDFLSDGTEQAIDANFISPLEKLKICDLMENANDLNKPIKIQLKSLLTFYIKLGLRPSENFKLELSDVVHHYVGLKNAITCRVNKLGRLKNPQSSRNILTDFKLTEAEDSNLNDYLAIRRVINADHFWIFDFESKEQNRIIFYNLLIDKIRSATGDSQLKIKSLRHTAATIEYLCYFGQTLSFLGCTPEFTKTFTLDNWFNVSVNDYITELFRSNLPSRRFAYRVGQSMGHSGAQTSLTNYSHFYEFVMPYFTEEGMPIVSNRAFHQMEKSIKPDYLRTLKSRLRKSQADANDEYLQNIAIQETLRRFLEKKENVNEKVANLRARGRLVTSNDLSDRNITLGIVEAFELLSYILLPTPKLELASIRFELTPEEVQDYIKAYANLRTKTGLDLFGYFDSNNPKKDLLNGDYFEIIASINNLIKKPTAEFLSLLKLWSDYIHPTHPYWHFETLEQRDLFKRALISELQIPESQIFLTTANKNFKKIEAIDPENKTPLRYAKQAEAHPVARIGHPTLTEKVKGLAVMNQEETRFLNEELNEIFFMANIIIDFLKT